jgi:hypothetical protein
MSINHLGHSKSAYGVTRTVEALTFGQYILVFLARKAAMRLARFAHSLQATFRGEMSTGLRSFSRPSPLQKGVLTPRSVKVRFNLSPVSRMSYSSWHKITVDSIAAFWHNTR